MFDKLIESRSHVAENRKRGGYFMTSFVLVVSLCLSAFLWNLFAKDLGIGPGEFELSTLIAPLPIPANAPAPVQKVLRREQLQNTKSEVIIRQTNMLWIDEQQPAPEKISVVPNTQKSRPNGHFLVKDGIETEQPHNSSAQNTGRSGISDSIDISNKESAQIETIEKTPPPPLPPIKKTVAESVEKRKPLVSDGVINGQATSLPKPPYPLAAKAVRAAGNVNVQVMIDETGKVISAKAIDGHILLRPAAEKAAWSAKFNPTLLSKQPVKVTGVIVYRFAVQ
jgi:TonB family protein